MIYNKIKNKKILFIEPIYDGKIIKNNCNELYIKDKYSKNKKIYQKIDHINCIYRNKYYVIDDLYDFLIKIRIDYIIAYNVIEMLYICSMNSKNSDFIMNEFLDKNKYICLNHFFNCYHIKIFPYKQYFVFDDLVNIYGSGLHYESNLHKYKEIFINMIMYEKKKYGSIEEFKFIMMNDLYSNIIIDISSKNYIWIIPTYNSNQFLLNNDIEYNGLDKIVKFEEIYIRIFFEKFVDIRKHFDLKNIFGILILVDNIENKIEFFDCEYISRNVSIGKCFQCNNFVKYLNYDSDICFDCAKDFKVNDFNQLINNYLLFLEFVEKSDNSERLPIKYFKDQIPKKKNKRFYNINADDIKIFKEKNRYYCNKDISDKFIELGLYNYFKIKNNNSIIC